MYSRLTDCKKLAALFLNEWMKIIVTGDSVITDMYKESHPRIPPKYGVATIGGSELRNLCGGYGDKMRLWRRCQHRMQSIFQRRLRRFGHITRMPGSKKDLVFRNA